MRDSPALAIFHAAPTLSSEISHMMCVFMPAAVCIFGVRALLAPVPPVPQPALLPLPPTPPHADSLIAPRPSSWCNYHSLTPGGPGRNCRRPGPSPMPPHSSSLSSSSSSKQSWPP